ncbi:hypothetical protein [Enterovibrio nigricans]|uniref:Uncharacterized protein n=1 Tax=Enterovibrio nigricans DSM 22720 TaxID=1121868 RepID=A0A1T4V5Q2_9GAMM|nr:hypothetical protein [Enterovibrio nigricans]PKF49877.1 hypothetical protein AT251_15620 [Enterovibrio nigricans]SKA60283.1 hypothetical protein SAMN02745132_03268 [Enterovibrio nigricans DSM 22720]
MALFNDKSLGEKLLLKILNRIKNQHVELNIKFIDKDDALESTEKLITLAQGSDVAHGGATELEYVTAIYDELGTLFGLLDTSRYAATEEFGITDMVLLMLHQVYDELRFNVAGTTSLTYSGLQNTNIDGSSQIAAFETELTLVAGSKFWSTDVVDGLYNYGGLWLLGDFTKEIISELAADFEAAASVATTFNKVDPDYEVPDYSGNELAEPDATSPGQEDPTSGDGEVLSRVVPDFLTTVDEDAPNYLYETSLLLRAAAQNFPLLGAAPPTDAMPLTGTYRASIEEARTYIDGLTFAPDTMTEALWALVLHLSNQMVFTDEADNGTRVFVI